MNLDDDRMSRILNSFLSSELNGNLTRRIDLGYNQLTKIPNEIYRFERLQRFALTGNRIASIGSLLLKSASSSIIGTNRMIKLISLNLNELSEISIGSLESTT